MTEVRRRRADKGGAICEMGGDRIGQGGKVGTRYKIVRGHAGGSQT